MAEIIYRFLFLSGVWEKPRTFTTYFVATGFHVDLDWKKDAPNEKNANIRKEMNISTENACRFNENKEWWKTTKAADWIT